MEFNISISVGGTLRGNKPISTPCVIGRSKEADLTIAHPVMSRKHCELFEETGKLYLRDNSSLNGTIFKNEYIEKPVQLQIGDEFSVGELTFKIVPQTASVTEEHFVLTDRPTAPMSAETNDLIGVATIVDSSQNLKSGITQVIPAEKISAEQTSEDGIPTEPVSSKKNSKKISPKDVRIVT